jgi:hypothetical protein
VKPEGRTRILSIFRALLGSASTWSFFPWHMIGVGKIEMRVQYLILIVINQVRSRYIRLITPLIVHGALAFGGSLRLEVSQSPALDPGLENVLTSTRARNYSSCLVEWPNDTVKCSLINVSIAWHRGIPIRRRQV